MKRLLLACAALAGAPLSGCGETENASEVAAGNTARPGGTGAAALDQVEGLSTAGRLLKLAGLDRLLSGPGSYTLFAPSDEAFASLPPEQRQQLESAEGRPQLVALLRQHMISGYVTPSDFNAAIEHQGPRVQIASLGVAPIVLRKQGEAILLGTGDQAARIVGQSVPVGTSIVYRIDRFLPPPRPS